MAAKSREELLKFLDREVFDPILRRSRDEFSPESEKAKFDDVKESTEAEKRRFHEDYESAEEVRERFMSDLHSSVGQRIQSESEALGLPSLPVVKDRFLKLCGDLGVSA